VLLPRALHVQEAFACYGYKAGDFIVSEKLAAQVLSLRCIRVEARTGRSCGSAITEIMASKLGVGAPAVWQPPLSRI